MRKLFLFPLLLYSLNCFSQKGSEIVNYKTYVKIEKEKLIKEVTFLIKISTENDDWLAQIKIPYSNVDKLEILEAKTLDLNGNLIRSLKKKIL